MSVALIFVILIGFGLGPLINFLADILPPEELKLQPPECSSCGQLLPAKLYFPVIGSLILKYHCPGCGGRLPHRHILVPIVSGAAFGLLYWRAEAAAPATVLLLQPIFWVYLIGTAALILIFITDFEHHLILNLVTYPTIALIILSTLLLNHRLLLWMAVGAVIAGGFFVTLYILGYLIYQEEALGFGDVKLAVLIGLLAGWPGIITVIFYGCLLAALGGGLLILLRKKSASSYMPLGTFLTLATYFTMLINAVH